DLTGAQRGRTRASRSTHPSGFHPPVQRTRPCHPIGAAGDSPSRTDPRSSPSRRELGFFPQESRGRCRWQTRDARRTEGAGEIARGPPDPFPRGFGPARGRYAKESACRGSNMKRFTLAVEALETRTLQTVVAAVSTAIPRPALPPPKVTLMLASGTVTNAD